ncbi:hypothetical protein OPT61_g2161 [Boeremia exigua]|uniref:Uncharacterized protein n=1 Tax=Boeremia exigua TaxID=749465 RepID=A0ACC2IMI1_9PLEO|nr:hypothetical protein OPT61_g2161 [Boeremia exigua]
MRLLYHGGDGEYHLIEFISDSIPAYAILSHVYDVWSADDSEVSFTDLIQGTAKTRAGYRKLQFCADQAAKDGLQYFWIGSCCIDRSSYAELSEAINSMFFWCSHATHCYVYLSDVSTSSQHGTPAKQDWYPAFTCSKWFSQGWTLQELLAPRLVEFFSADGLLLGDKISMLEEIHDITGIPIKALQGTPLADFSFAERASWMDHRQTVRQEEVVYALLGIFGVSLTPIYGEGRKTAFGRLWNKVHHLPHGHSRSPSPDKSKVASSQYVRSAAVDPMAPAALYSDSEDGSKIASVFSHGAASISSASTAITKPIQTAGIREVSRVLLSNEELETTYTTAILNVERRKARSHIRGLLKDYGRNLLKEMSSSTLAIQAAKFVQQLAGCITDEIIWNITGFTDPPPLKSKFGRQGLDTWLSTLQGEGVGIIDQTYPSDEEYDDDPSDDDLTNELEFPNIDRVKDFLLNSEAFRQHVVAMRSWLKVDGVGRADEDESATGTAEHIEVGELTKEAREDSTVSTEHPQQIYLQSGVHTPETVEETLALSKKLSKKERKKKKKKKKNVPITEDLLLSNPLVGEDRQFSTVSEVPTVELNTSPAVPWIPDVEQWPPAQEQKTTHQYGETEQPETVEKSPVLSLMKRKKLLKENQRISKAEGSLLSTPLVEEDRQLGAVSEVPTVELNTSPAVPWIPDVGQQPQAQEERTAHRDCSSLSVLISSLLDYWGISFYFYDLVELFVPQPSPGYRRLRWRCSCNTVLWGDFSVKDDAAFDQLKREVLGPRDRPAQQVPASAVSSTQTTTHSSRPDLQTTLVQQKSLARPSSPLEFFEVCVSVGNHAIDHHEIDISRVDSDSELFELVWDRYNISRGRGLRRLFLRPSDVNFVMFYISRHNNYGAGIHKKPDEFPPQEELDTKRYHYHCPQIRMPANVFLHYLHRARWNIWGEHSESTWPRRLPEKLDRSLVIDALQQSYPSSSIQPVDPDLAFGWGIHIIDGPNQAVLGLLLAVGVAVLFVVSGMVVGFAKIQEQGFGVGSFLLAIVASTMAAATPPSPTPTMSKVHAIKLLQASADPNDISEFRLLINHRHIKYVTIDPYLFDDMDLIFEPTLIEILRPLLPAGDWHHPRISQAPSPAEGCDENAKVRFETCTQVLPGIRETWHPVALDYLDLEIDQGHNLRSNVCEATCAKLSGRFVVKFARFHWEVAWLERETLAYRWIDGHGIGPQFLGHVTEHGRVIGFGMSRFEDARHATPGDGDVCQQALRRLHALGIKHGDTNKHNFLIQPHGVVLIDFDCAKQDATEAELGGELDGLEQQLADVSGRGGVLHELVDGTD